MCVTKILSYIDRMWPNNKNSRNFWCEILHDISHELSRVLRFIIHRLLFVEFKRILSFHQGRDLKRQ